MSDWKLVIGDKNYSSWSLRAWLALRQAGVPFEEQNIRFAEDADRAQRLRHSPTGRVPVLHHGERTIWDSLAIGEYLAESFPERGLWPKEAEARARARSLCAEMHSGFTALRASCPMDFRSRKPAEDRGSEVRKDVERIAAMWSDTRKQFGAGGPYLFGAWSLADAFYAPVASRCRTYSLPLEGEAAAYRDAVLEQADVLEWVRGAEAELQALGGSAEAT